jgi:hypothetical protein
MDMKARRLIHGHDLFVLIEDSQSHRLCYKVKLCCL